MSVVWCQGVKHTGEVHIQKIAADKQLADIVTKDSVGGKFVPLRDALMGWNLDSAGSNGSNVHSRGSVGDAQSARAPRSKGTD